MSAVERLANQGQIWKEMHAERIRAHEKHKDKPGGSMEVKKWDDPDWSDVLMEEVGEASRERNDFRHGLQGEEMTAIKLRKELIQVGAMAAAWVAAIDEAWDTGA